jgi:phenylacetate-CoA ligase
LVKGPEFSDSFIEQIRTGFKRRLGQSVQVDVDVVDNIAAEKSGKFRYIISHAIDKV